MKFILAIALFTTSSFAAADTADIGKLNCRIFAFAHMQPGNAYDHLVSDWLVQEFIDLGDQKAQLLMADMPAETLDGLGYICAQNQTLTLKDVLPVLKQRMDNTQFK